MDKRNFRRRAALFLYFLLTTLWMEFAVKLFCLGGITGRGALWTTVFTLPMAVLMLVICELIGPKHVKAAAVTITAVLFVLFGTQMVYNRIFRTFLSLVSVGGADKVIANFWREALAGIAASWLRLLTLAVPLVLVSVFGGRFSRGTRTPARGMMLIIILGIVLQALAISGVLSSDSGVMPISEVYTGSRGLDLSINNFGVLTTYRRDLEGLTGEEELLHEIETEIGSGIEAVIEPEPKPVPEPEPESESAPAPEVPEIPEEYGPNTLDIDFPALIASAPNDTVRDMHEHFSSVTPTYKNEYTGMFEGKNLIWIVAESFSRFAPDPELTPTLYRLSKSGFVFENFYTPGWAVSTSDGEYVTLTGLVPKPGVWSLYSSGSNDMSFTFGHMLGKRGYTTYAFHNHTYDYYDRNISHPNLGYEYIGRGNGLEVTDQWPESDLEMMEATVPMYIDDEPFHIYYLTVSGHMNYNFYGNAMSVKHEAETAELPYSDGPRAYLACQIELDLAMEELLSRLDEAGVLDDTVIVLSADHYPYGLTDSELNELAGEKLDPVFEKYRSTLILWNSAMDDPVYVDKYCASLDIMPTLANLFGLDYDSRLFAGRDILSDSEGLVIFSDCSFITAEGRYSAAYDDFVTSDGSEPDYERVQAILQDVIDRSSYSTKILENDYFAYISPYMS